MSQKSSFWKKKKLVFCTAAWSIFIIAAAVWLTIFLIGTLSRPFWDNAPVVSDSVISPTEKKVERYHGEWEISKSKISSHPKNIGHGYESDKWTFCVKCHGPAPHSRTPKERSFLNMHGLFMSCYVCHVREQNGIAPTHFGWLNLASGLLCSSNPKMDEGVWGEYGAKIVPLNSEKNPQPVKLKEEEALAVKLHKDMEKLNDHQKAIDNKFIHRRCVEMPVHCIDCHNSEKAFLPYTMLGYTAERAAFLMSAEMADFAKHYETFYVPKPLNTGTITPDATKDVAK
ncbi:MAG: hypothetical protein WCW64_03620 [Phycisphaerae bacterium]|jgi:hypothetical protein